jgi:hypothetical protein
MSKFMTFKSSDTSGRLICVKVKLITSISTDSGKTLVKLSTDEGYYSSETVAEIASRLIHE